MSTTLKVVDNGAKEVGSVKLPVQFSEPIRADLIKRAVLAVQANNRQAYGADPRAGKKHSANVSRRRRQYRGSYGKGISRVPRKILSRNGVQFNWVAAEMPGVRGGRQAHPPKAEKIWDQKVNDQERRKAIRSALSATVDATVVANRGHKVPANYPFVLADDFEKVTKTKDFQNALIALGFTDELARTKEPKIRAGKGKARGRKYKKSVGPLVVVSNSCEAAKAARNIPGVQIVQVDKLNAELLAPGCAPGRVTVFTKAAIEKLEADKLYQ